MKINIVQDDPALLPELVQLLYRQSRPAIIGSFLVASFLVIVLYRTVPTGILFTWFGLMLLVTGVRFVLIKFYLKKPRANSNNFFWRNQFILMTLLAGIAWSFAGIVLLPLGHSYQTFIICSLAGVTAGAVPYFSGNRLACFAFFVPILLPFALLQMLQTTTAEQMLGLLTILYLVLLSLSCLRTHAAIYNSIKLKFENAELVKDLTDMALYRAKDELQINAELRKKIEFANQLRSAIEQDELVLHYQPVMNISSNSIDSMEALVRWNHPTLGLIYPDNFIPFAEEVGLIIPLGEWVIEKVCQQIVTWRANFSLHKNFRIAINVSTHQFRHANFAKNLREVLDKYLLEGNALLLELTESVLMEDFDYSIALITALKKLGILFALDDFGTGYSSLSYLSRLPIDILKIDRSFVNNLILQDGITDAENIIKAIITLAQSLQLRVIAEGVETDKQYQFLKKLGCDEIQGYLLSKPLPEAFVTRFFKPHFSMEDNVKSSYTQ